jgi:endoglucanase
LIFLFLLSFLYLTAVSQSFAADVPVRKGFNLAGAEFRPQTMPGKHKTDYLWPDSTDIALYANTGALVLRIPLRWERMQRRLHGPLDREELARLDQVVMAAAERNLTIIIDVHNYGQYGGALIGSPQVPVAAFSDFWSRLASHYKDVPNVMFGLMNEPYKQSAAKWAAIARQALLAIRSAGAHQPVLLPGTHWSGAHSWLKGGKTSNAAAFENFEDPAGTFMFDLHQYLDIDSSGTHATCVSEDIGERRINKVTLWLRANGYHAFLSEFGASAEPLCLKAMKNMLAYMDQNNDVWKGWSYWGASRWFGKYMFNVYPPDPKRYPQLEVLLDNIRGADTQKRLIDVRDFPP